LYHPPKRKKDTPLAAIKAFCYYCLGEVWEDGEKITDGLNPGKDCNVKDCPLFDYRTGRGPKKNMSDADKAKFVERMKGAC